MVEAYTTGENRGPVVITLTRGEKRVTVTLDDLEVRKISSIFRVEGGTLFLLKDGNQAIFPSNAGRFNPSQLDPSYSYEVHGDDSISQRPSQNLQVPSPFGSYPSFSSSPLSPPFRPHPPLKGPAAKFHAYYRPHYTSKTIVLVTLHDIGDKATSSKAAKLTYEVVTNLPISIDPSDCSPSAVACNVTKSVGFEVILLDSKCFPLPDTETTSVLAFWKSSRKILAASKALYHKLSGSSTDVKRAVSQDKCIDLTESEEETSTCSKRICLEEMMKKVDKLEANFEFSKKLLKVFECVICKGVSKEPITSSCCFRVIGCKQCVNQWLSVKKKCPHCATATLASCATTSTSTSASFNILKGVDDVIETALIITGTNVEEADENNESTRAESISDDEDFELPRVSFRRPFNH